MPNIDVIKWLEDIIELEKRWNNDIFKTLLELQWLILWVLTTKMELAMGWRNQAIMKSLRS